MSKCLSVCNVCKFTETFTFFHIFTIILSMNRYYTMSSSSSECDSDQNWPYQGYNYNMNYSHAYGRNHPFYPTMGHPLVYLAQTPKYKKQRDRKRNNPNCFVKAFRWYTKEPGTRNNDLPQSRQDLSRFAAWLDKKYDQFLEENHVDSCQFQNSVGETCETEGAPNDICEPSLTRGRSKKSLWKRKRRAKSTDGDNGQQRFNQSCHYIMQPKEVSRSPSVCCNLSRATVNETECGTKSMGRSHSLSNVTTIIRSKDPCNTTPAQGDVGEKITSSICRNNTCKYASSQSNANKISGSKQSAPDKANSDNKSPSENIQVPETKKKNKKQDKNVETKDFSCQCGVERLATANAETQYEPLKSNTQQPINTVAGKSSLPACQVDTTEICYCPPLCQSSPKTAQIPVGRKESHKNVKVQYEDVECQCPETKVTTTDAETQYSSPPPISGDVCYCNSKGYVLHSEEKAPQYIKPYSKSLSVSCCSCETNVKGVFTQNTFIAQKEFAQNTSQTSNLSIRLEEKNNLEWHKYPLFLKIVCADKLSNDNVK